MVVSLKNFINYELNLIVFEVVTTDFFDVLSNSMLSSKPVTETFCPKTLFISTISISELECLCFMEALKSTNSYVPGGSSCPK